MPLVNIGYEAREFFKAIPQAYRRSRSLIAPALNWLREPHPFIYSGMVIGTIATTNIFYWIIKTAEDGVLNFFTVSFLVVASFLYELAFSVLAMVIIGSLAELGARQKNNYFAEVGVGGQGLNEMPTTYSNVFHCCAVGFACVITTVVMFCLFKGWYYLAKGVWSVLRFVGHFSYHLFKLVHSKGRIICGLYGVLGGLMTWAFLMPETANLVQSLFLIFCGGSISVVIGKVLGFEIIAKRILKVVPNGAPTSY